MSEIIGAGGGLGATGQASVTGQGNPPVPNTTGLPRYDVTVVGVLGRDRQAAAQVIEDALEDMVMGATPINYQHIRVAWEPNPEPQPVGWTLERPYYIGTRETPAHYAAVVQGGRVDWRCDHTDHLTKRQALRCADAFRATLPDIVREKQPIIVQPNDLAGHGGGAVRYGWASTGEGAGGV
jgi:hypothetical protein